jgi:hypothetical protein
MTSDYLPTQDEIREWCRYFQSTWTREQEQERAGCGARVRAMLREVRISKLDSNDCLLEDD